MGGRLLGGAVCGVNALAELSTTVEPTRGEVKLELAATSDWDTDTTFEIARRRKIALNWWLVITPEESEKGPEKVKMLMEWVSAELERIQAFTRAPQDMEIVHPDLRNFRGALSG